MTTSSSEALTLASGQRLVCRVCSTRVVVLDPGSADQSLQCDGEPFEVARPIACSSSLGTRHPAARTVAGAIYSDTVTGLRLRCIQSGPGMVTIGGRVLVPEVRGLKVGVNSV
jgi:hypothetical protein